MNKQALTFPCLLLAVLLWIPLASAAGPSGNMQVENRNYADAVLSFDAKLSGEEIQGDLFAAVFAESGQMKSASAYPAKEAVSVALEGVAANDYIKLIWTGQQCVPLAEPVILRMSENGSSAYAQFAEAFLKLQEQYGGGGGSSSDSEDPYVLARLLVSASELPDLSAYQVAATIAGPDNLYILQFLSAGKAKECAEYLRTCPTVRYAEPDSVMRADEIEPTESARLSAAAPLSWGAEATGIMEYAENLRERGANHEILVAAVDSGADMGHSFLSGRLVPGYDFIDDDDVPQDGHNHGTHVAGIIADCTQGLNVKIMPVRSLDDFNSGSVSSISSGVRYAADHGANIINLSLSLALGHNAYLEEAISYAVSKNITVVVAAGNQNADVKGRCPAHMEECVTVAAADRNWRRFELSNYGETVDIAAPGVEIYSSLRGEKYGEMSGTSMAAPHVSAAAALLMCERGTAQTPDQISRALRDSAASLDLSALNADGERVPFGAGFLNLTPFIIRPQRTIAFYPNGGAGTMSPQSAASGSLVALKANAFSYVGFAFDGWNTKADGSGVAYPNRAALTVTENLSLYAQWKPEKRLYALLYADGELVFQNDETPSPDKTPVQTYPIPLTGGDGQYVGWYARRAEIQTVAFAGKIQPVSTALWFYGCENLTEIRELENLDVSAVTDMSQMFSRCTSLETLDLRGWDTTNVADMRRMFFQCSSLRTIYVSETFDVSKVTESEDMFTGCTSLIGGAGTQCDGASHTNQEYARIDNPPSAPGYFTEKPSGDVYAVLYSDGELVFQNNNRTQAGRVVSKIYGVDLGAVYEYDTFPWKNERNSIRVVNFADKISPISAACWFYDCVSLIRVENIGNLETSSLVNMSRMFCNCGSLTALDVTGFDTSQVIDMSNLFFSCGNLRALDVSGWNVAKVADMGAMFSGCRSLTELDVSGWNVEKLESASFMFSDCQGLTELDLSGWNPAALADTQNMFYNSGNLKTIYVSGKFVTDSVRNGFNMFEGCAALIGGAGTKFDDAHTDKDYARIDGGTSAPGYFTDIRKIKVTFDANGGMFGDGLTTKEIETNRGATVTAPTDITRNGYSFLWWNTNADGSGTYYKGGASLTVTGNMTLYAQFVSDPVPMISWGATATHMDEYASLLQERGNLPEVIIAVVDSGVDLSHPFLQGRLVAGHDFVGEDDTPQDEHGHGTHVAGIIADCTPDNVKIMPVRVLDASNSGSVFAVSSGIRYAANHGANVINLSLLLFNHSQTIEDAIQYALSRNVTVVAPAGNQRADAKNLCPAHMEDCITVAAVDKDLKRFDLSNYGEAVDIAAPGVEIYGRLLNGKYGEMSGTSMAAAHVSSAAALLMCEYGVDRTPAQIAELLKNTAMTIPEDTEDSGWKAYQEAGHSWSEFLGAGFLDMTMFLDGTANLSAEELFHLGEDYFNGANGKPKDYEKSRYYYQKSADKGNMYAINDLGYIYQKGYGVAVDYNKAFALYSQAAEMGNPHALNNLGYMYENGLGVAQDYQKALDYYQRAADGGSKMASANLTALRLLMPFL